MREPRLLALECQGHVAGVEQFVAALTHAPPELPLGLVLFDIGTDTIVIVVDPEDKVLGALRHRMAARGS